jgi:rhodanese-related sulfurtransferase
MALPWWWPFGRVPEISSVALAGALAGRDPPQLVDVRTAAEFAAGRIPGARSAPVHTLPGAIEGLGLDPARPVVAVCLSGHRSTPAVRLLRARGFEAAQLAGGMLSWRRDGRGEER